MAPPKSQRSFILPATLAVLLVLSAAANIWLALHHVNVTQFVILPPAANSNIMCAYQREALDALTRGVILGTNTRMDMLTAGEKLRHELVLERMAIKTALMGRSKQIHAAIKKHAPKLLK